MLEQVSTAVKFLAFYVASKQCKTGLTVTVDVYDPTSTKIVTDGTVTEIGGGLYRYTLASGSTGTEGEYVAVFKTSDATVDAQHIPALWVIGRAGVEDLDATVSSRSTTTGVWDQTTSGHVSAGTFGQALNAAGSASDPLLNNVPGSYAAGSAGSALGRIGSGSVEATVPVASGGAVSLVAGDDYSNSDARSLEWTDDQANWPALTSATILLHATGTYTTMSKAGTVVVATGAGKKVRVELTAAETLALDVGGYVYAVRATLPTSSRVITLATGGLTVRRQV